MHGRGAKPAIAQCYAPLLYSHAHDFQRFQALVCILLIHAIEQIQQSSLHLGCECMIGQYVLARASIQALYMTHL